LPRAAQATVKAKLGDARIEEIEKELEKRQVVYQVEAKKDGTKIEFKVNDAAQLVDED